MSIQSLLKPNNYNLFTGSLVNAGDSIQFEPLFTPGVPTLLTASQIINGLVLAQSNSGGTLILTLPALSTIYSGSGGTGPVNPNSYSFNCIFHANEDGSGGVTINSSGGVGNIRIRDGSGGVLVLAEGQTAFANFYLYLNAGVPSADMFYVLN